MFKTLFSALAASVLIAGMAQAQSHTHTWSHSFSHSHQNVYLYDPFPAPQVYTTRCGYRSHVVTFDGCNTWSSYKTPAPRMVREPNLHPRPIPFDAAWPSRGPWSHGVTHVVSGHPTWTCPTTGTVWVYHSGRWGVPVYNAPHWTLP